MIKIRGVFLSAVIDKLPLPDVMRKEIKTIPHVHCEYQHVDRDNKFDKLQSPDADMDPLAQSRSLIVEENSSTRDLTHTPDINKSSNVCLQKSTSIKTKVEDLRTEITAEIVSQSPTLVHPSPARNKTKREKEIQAY